MSGELTYGEVMRLMHGLDVLGAHVTDEVNRIGAKLGGHIDWLAGQIEERDKTIERLESEIERHQENAAELSQQIEEMGT
jgi:peptidoglycan hydrolase CwlO-like protein